MSKLIAGMASSHAIALEEPTDWNQRRERSRRLYAHRYGTLPEDNPRVAGESDEDIQRRYGRIREGHALLRRKLEELRPQALVMVGDDQNENFTDANLPQIAIYLGDQFVADHRGPGNRQVRHASEAGLAAAILDACVESDIDMAFSRSFPEDRLLAHAFGPLLRVIDPEAKVPVVLVFVNAIHMPAPSPARCYYLGEVIRRATEEYSGLERVVVCASGGLSHFTSGYPWSHYEGPFGFGSISEEFDRGILARMEAGEGRELARLSTQDLLAHGEIELRSWITMLGAIGGARPEMLVYEPLYRGIMGMGVGYWDLTE